MNYATYIPDIALSPFVKCYWVLEGSREAFPEKQRIIPDGCMEMIFHFGDLYKQHLPNGKTIIQPRCFVIGQLTAPLEIEPTGMTGIFSVRFLPEGFCIFSKFPLKKLENKAIELGEIFGEEGVQIATSILNAKTVAEKITLVETFLKDHLTNKKNIDRVVKQTVEIMLKLKGQLSVDMLLQELNINRKQLERKFSSEIGLSPKQLAKIIRLQATLKLFKNKKAGTLTSIAYAGDYYDQAHFIKDFKEFTGFTPKKFYADNLLLSSLFSEEN